MPIIQTPHQAPPQGFSRIPSFLAGEALALGFSLKLAADTGFVANPTPPKPLDVFFRRCDEWGRRQNELERLEHQAAGVPMDERDQRFLDSLTVDERAKAKPSALVRFQHSAAAAIELFSQRLNLEKAELILKSKSSSQRYAGRVDVLEQMIKSIQNRAQQGVIARPMDEFDTRDITILLRKIVTSEEFTTLNPNTRTQAATAKLIKLIRTLHNSFPFLSFFACRASSDIFNPTSAYDITNRLLRRSTPESYAQSRKDILAIQFWAWHAAWAAYSSLDDFSGMYEAKVKAGQIEEEIELLKKAA